MNKISEQTNMKHIRLELHIPVYVIIIKEKAIHKHRQWKHRVSVLEGGRVLKYCARPTVVEGALVDLSTACVG